MIRAAVPSSGAMRRPLRLVLIGLGVVLAGLMAVGYSFIFRGVATAPDATLGTVEVPGPGDVVATASLDDGTPIFVVSFDGTLNVLDARSPVPEGSLPLLAAWCEPLAAFDTGASSIDIDPVNRLGFDADGTAFGPFESRGLTRYAIQRDERELVILSSSTQAGGRIDEPPDCPAGAEHVMHRPEPGEVFDPSVAIDAEPPGVIWLEGTLRAIGNQALLCDGIDTTHESCASGAVARGIDPATIAAEGTAGLFIGVVRDGGIVGLAHALVLTRIGARP
jgi:hypothetical protein